MFVKDMYMQWLSGRVLDSRWRGPDSSLNSVTALCPCARHIYPSLVLVSTQEDLPYIIERLLMGRKESNQTKNQTVYFAEACESTLFAFWQTSYYVWSVRSLNSRWNQILYCSKILSTNCLQIYNLLLLVPCYLSILCAIMNKTQPGGCKNITNYKCWFGYNSRN